METGNMFRDLPVDSDMELFSGLIAGPGFKLERIVSTGQATPAGEWLEQDQEEWVVLLSGSAGLLIEGEDARVELIPGDYLHIPAHCRHRVQWTDDTQPSVWLALHYDAQADETV